MVKYIIKTESGSVYEFEHGLFGVKLKRNGSRMIGYIWPTKIAHGVEIDEHGHVLHLESDFKEGLHVLIWDAERKEFLNSTKITSVMKE